MKINMAEGDYFNIGMIVSCTTCHGQKIQGEVTAFDYQTKMLVLKSQPSSGKANTNDVTIINLAVVSNVKMIKEATQPPPPLCNLNTAKISSRLKGNLEEKRNAVNYIGVNVSPEAQKLLHAITKTIKEVIWDGDNIVVMNQVTIVPPYGIENCTAKGENSHVLLQHVRKLVEKYHRENGKRESSERDLEREGSVSSTSS